MILQVKRWLLSLLSLQWLAERSWDRPTLLVIIINKHRLKLKHLFREWKIRLGQIRTLLQQIVGKDVVISIDGKTTKAEVISIDGEKAVVKTPDGNQYKIQAHLSDNN